MVQGYTSGVFWQGFGAFFTPIVDHFGWSRGVTAAAVSLQRTESGMISPFVGVALDKFGPRKLVAFGLATTGIGFMLMSQMHTLWQFYAVMMLLTVGMSFGTFITLVTTVNSWFVRQRSRAIAALMSCSAIGGMAIPLLVWFVDSIGWRGALFWVGVGFLIVGAPLIVLIRRRPEDYGLLPDGDPPPSEQKPGQAGQRARFRREYEIPVRAAVRTRFFWQLAIATSLGHLLSATTLLHIDAIVSFGLSRTTAGLTVFGFATASLAGRAIFGFLGDFWDKRYLMAIAYNVQIVGMLALASLNATWLGISFGAWGLPVYAVFFGFGFGSSIPVRLAMLGDYFGRRSYGSILGIMSTINAVLGALGPVFVGSLFDITGSYRVPFLALTVILLATGPMMLTLDRPPRVAAQFRLAARRHAAARA